MMCYSTHLLLIGMIIFMTTDCPLPPQLEISTCYMQQNEAVDGTNDWMTTRQKVHRQIEERINSHASWHLKGMVDDILIDLTDVTPLNTTMDN